MDLCLGIGSWNKRYSRSHSRSRNYGLGEPLILVYNEGFRESIHRQSPQTHVAEHTLASSQRGLVVEEGGVG